MLKTKLKKLCCFHSCKNTIIQNQLKKLKEQSKLNENITIYFT